MTITAHDTPKTESTVLEPTSDNPQGTDKNVTVNVHSPTPDSNKPTLEQVRTEERQSSTLSSKATRSR